MGVRRPADPAEATEGKERGPAQQYMDLGPRAEPPPGSGQQSFKDNPTGRGVAEHRPAASLRDWLPRGGTLDDETIRHRHRILCWLLGLHVPALLVFGLWRGIDSNEMLVGLSVPVASLLLALLVTHRRLSAFFVTAGLVFCSSVLVYFSGGAIEAHFHFFVLIGFIALYQDWILLLWNAVFVVISHGFGSALAPDAMYNHPAAQNSPWLWAAIHGVAVLGACLGVIVYWRQTELVQQRNIALTNQLAAAQVANAQTEVERRQSISALLVHLARRNQSLLDRQLGLIGDLEQQERAPETLSELFRLDHLATRMRRNAESLLVLSGEEPPRRWGRPVALVEVVRAAAAEVEDYDRVEVLVGDHLHVEGRVVADLAHLVAELIENATIFSPPDTEVRVQSYPSPGRGSGFVLSIEDMGIGMSENDLRKANQLLADAPEVDLRWMTLGFHVVSRLAKRYELDVRVASTPGGGVTALVTLPPGLVTERVPTMLPAGTAGSTNTGETRSVANPPRMTGTAGGMALPQVRWTPTEAGARELPPPSSGLPGGFARPLSLPAGGTPSLPSPPVPRAPSLPSPTDRPPLPPQNTPSARGGLTRRVPGARLAPPLREPPHRALREGNESASPTDDSSAESGTEGPWGAWGGPSSESVRAHDSREHVRSMLSRFQASQRAARAVSGGPLEASASDQEQGHGDEPEQELEPEPSVGASGKGWLSRFEASQQAGRAVAGAPVSEFATGAVVSTGETVGPDEGRHGSGRDARADVGMDPAEKAVRPVERSDPYQSVGSDQDGQGQEALEEHEEQGGDQDG